ncbi:MAG: hypothetical protein MZU97_15370 [Bacillus subtilis]|nr:hypothetical protein [Bacillus subtilis]
MIFYDFYLGYMALAFVSFLFVIEYFKRPNFKLGKFLVSGASFLGLLLLGVALSAIILYPSILFILEDTYRPEGFFDAWVIEIRAVQAQILPTGDLHPHFGENLYRAKSDRLLWV